MPKYIYKCNSCLCEQEITHSISEKLKDCSECGAEDSLERIPGGFMKINSEVSLKKKNAGQVVRSTIEETKQILKDERRSVKKWN